MVWSNKACARRPIAGVVRSSLPVHIPSLAEMLDSCGSGFDLSLDLKDPRSGPAVIDAVRNHDEQFVERLWLCDTDLDRLAALRHGRRRRPLAAVDEAGTHQGGRRASR